MEVQKLQKQLNSKNYTEVYRENEMMKMELKSMLILNEENADLKEDLERLQKMSYDDRVKEVGLENLKLSRRNGELLI